MPKSDYNNGLFDAYRERKEIEAQADAARADALLTIANKPASSTSRWLIILPLSIVLIGGAVAIVLIKKKGK